MQHLPTQQDKLEAGLRRVDFRSIDRLTIGIVAAGATRKIEFRSAGRIVFVASVERPIVHQIGSRLYGFNQEWENISMQFSHDLHEDRAALERRIVEVLQRHDLVALVRDTGSVVGVYGIVSKSFQRVPVSCFRSSVHRLLARLGKSHQDSVLRLSSYGGIYETFPAIFVSPQVRFDLQVHYPRNNGYDAGHLSWNRSVIICSNGLFRSDRITRYRWIHLASSSMNKALEEALHAGEELRHFTENRIQSSMERPLDRHQYRELRNRLYLAEVSRERVDHRLALEAKITGITEWSLSQALTWLGTHERALTRRSKEVLQEVGTGVLETGLEAYLREHVRLFDDGEPAGPLLPQQYRRNLNPVLS
jgi:hypothetical protein